MSNTDNTKHKAPKSAKKMLVSYGRIGTLGWFEHNEAHIPKLCAHVVIKTKRGLELGKIVGVHNYRGGQFKSSPEQVEEYFCNRTKDYPLGDGGRFVRFATAADLSEQRHLEKNAIGEAKTCQRITEELGLKMKIVEAEHLFGGERIIFYFTSENRVDFRELVRQLAKEYQTRIELRQIGSRDEARLVSDYESCGQQCCCSRFLKILEPVNMRMAKLQKATLDPSKISGHCGRLKCCLRYEDENYLELKRKMPHRSTPVQTPKGPGKVVDTQILTQLVIVQMDSGNRQAWPLDEIQILKPGQTAKRPVQGETGKGAGGNAVKTESAAAESGRPQRNEQDSEPAEKTPQAPSAQNGDSGSQQPGKRRGNKNRRRRSKNKQGGSPNNQNAQNSQKNPPAQNKNRQGSRQKPSNGNTAQPSGE
ncbi:MAG: PSP1 domain-containing protein [Planctomycetota bacterium]|jgi:cell fate regulator YaaT (PSP1 superfamily)